MDIPVFFAIDDSYINILQLSVSSIKHFTNKSNTYQIHILYCDISKENQEKIKKFQDDNFKIYFDNIKEKLKNTEKLLFTRDYYSKSTYYRLFIPKLFPNIDKAIYIDADTILNSDIANLFNYPINDNLLGAIPDESVQIIPEFINYVEKYLGIQKQKYFNAGVLVMNLKELRKFDFENKFINLINAISFEVAQDQDYLNVICKDRVCYLPLSWNKMPFENKNYTNNNINLIHYNLCFKPWHYSDIFYSDLFYYFAKKENLLPHIKTELDNYSENDKIKDYNIGENLKSLANEKANSKNTFAELLNTGKIKI